jgi:hypothetical protein
MSQDMNDLIKRAKALNIKVGKPDFKKEYAEKPDHVLGNIVSMGLSRSDMDPDKTEAALSILEQRKAKN